MVCTSLAVLLFSAAAAALSSAEDVSVQVVSPLPGCLAKMDGEGGLLLTVELSSLAPAAAGATAAPTAVVDGPGSFCLYNDGVLYGCVPRQFPYNARENFVLDGLQTNGGGDEATTNSLAFNVEWLPGTAVPGSSAAVASPVVTFDVPPQKKPLVAMKVELENDCEVVAYEYTTAAAHRAASDGARCATWRGSAPFQWALSAQIEFNLVKDELARSESAAWATLELLAVFALVLLSCTIRAAAGRAVGGKAGGGVAGDDQILPDISSWADNMVIRGRRLGGVDILRGVGLSLVCVHHATSFYFLPGKGAVRDAAFLPVRPLFALDSLWRDEQTSSVEHDADDSRLPSVPSSPTRGPLLFPFVVFSQSGFGCLLSFTVSGFVLAWLFERRDASHSGGGGGKWVDFVRKRLWSLLPPYYLVVLFVLLSRRGDVNGEDGGGDLWGLATLAAKGCALATVGFQVSPHWWWPERMGFEELAPFWTMGPQVAFIVLSPVACMLCRRWPATSALVAIAFSSAVRCWFYGATNQELDGRHAFLYDSILGHADSFVVGVSTYNLIVGSVRWHSEARNGRTRSAFHVVWWCPGVANSPGAIWILLGGLWWVTGCTVEELVAVDAVPRWVASIWAYAALHAGAACALIGAVRWTESHNGMSTHVLAWVGRNALPIYLIHRTVLLRFFIERRVAGVPMSTLEVAVRLGFSAIFMVALVNVYSALARSTRRPAAGVVSTTQAKSVEKEAPGGANAKRPVTSSFRPSSTLFVIAVLLLSPIILGAGVSYWLTFRCCNGMGFSPVPWLGFFRWDVSGAVWLGLLAVAILLFSLTWFCLRRDGHRLLLAGTVAGALYAGAWYAGDYIAAQHAVRLFSFTSGRDFYVTRAETGAKYFTYRSFDDPRAWDELTMSSQPAPIGAAAPPGPVRVLNESVLSAKECADAVAFTFAHAEELMHDMSRPIPTAYITFGGDTNFERHADPVGEGDVGGGNPAFTFLFGRYRFQGGLEAHMGRITGHHLDDAAHVVHVRKLYREGLAVQLNRVRAALERHLGSSPGRVMLGGDPGSPIHDFAPPSIIIQLPNKLLETLINPHHDQLPWDVDVISKRLGDQHAGVECGTRGDGLFGGTIALEIPRGGSGLLWWHESQTPPVRRVHTPYVLGKLVMVPRQVYHSIAPWPYNGWVDRPRVTMQMFVLRCDISGGGGDPFWYVFH